LSEVPAALVALANRLADAAGAIARKHFRTAVPVDIKPDATPVSLADRAIEEAIRDILAKERPGDGILGEEFGTERLDAEFVWVIDPIDGTKPFITGRPSFGHLIGLTLRGRPVLGVIDQSIARERWVGVSGQGATLNGAPIRTRLCPDLSRAALYANAPEFFTGEDGPRFQKLRSAVSFAQYSGDCYAYGLLAAGFVDIVMEKGLKPFDWVALVPVVEGAGGRITDFSFRPLTLESEGRVLALGDPALAPKIAALIA